MPLELKRTRFELAIKQVDLEAGTFEGHASIFGIPDDGMPPDIILPGAFAKTIQEWGPKGANRIKVLALHRSDWLPIGRPLELAEDAKGLGFLAKISTTVLGTDVLTLMRDGVLTEMSIGFQTIKADFDQKTNARLVREVRLFEISPVTWAMHPLAKIEGVKGVKHRTDFAALPTEDPASSPNPASPAAPAAASGIDPATVQLAGQSIKATTELLRTLTRRTA